MKIGLQTWGSEGDIRPMLALGYGLMRAGHEVTLGLVAVDGRDLAALARPLGIPTTSIGADYFEANRDALRVMVERIGRVRNPLRQVQYLLDHFYDPVQEAQYHFSQTLCATHDLVIGHFLVDTLAVAAARSQRSYVSLMPVGSVPSRAHPPVGVPHFGGWGNRLAWRMADWFMQRQFGPRLNRLRRREGLAPLANGLGEEGFWSRQLNLIANSPTLYPPQPDWPPWHKVCGFLHSPDLFGGIDPRVEAFLAAGPPPVYMTLGSMLTVPQPRRVLEESVEALLEAARLSGVRAIVQAPWSVLDDQAPTSAHILPGTPDVLRLSRAPHEQLFPRCSLVVHHGGAGTTHAALTAGRPAVVIPHAVDQMQWARTLVRLGVAPAALPRRRLTGHRLARRIQAVLAHPPATWRARRLGAQMRTEDGIAQAIHWVEDLAEGGQGAVRSQL